MKLQQLRYLQAIAQSDLNISAAARRLHTSQPGVSKQIQLLEEEIGLPLFERDGRSLARLTPAGTEVLERALRILRDAEDIRRIAKGHAGRETGSLSIGTTHTQARYVLPPVFQRFSAAYPGVELHLHQGTSEQIADLARLDQVDFVIATGTEELFPGMILLPCYRWHRCVVVPAGHPLADGQPLTMQRLADYPIVTYVFSLKGASSLLEKFASAGLEARIALTARDSDVIQTYVRLGFGVGIIASMSYDPEHHAGLVAVDASHLFPAHTTWIGFRHGTVLTRYMKDFIGKFAPHLTPRFVEEVSRPGSSGVHRAVPDEALPVYGIGPPANSLRQ